MGDNGVRARITTASPTLRAILEQSKVPLKQLADGVSRPYTQLLMWSTGKHEPRIMAVEELAQAAGCKIVVMPASEADLLDALGYEVIVRRKGTNV